MDEKVLNASRELFDMLVEYYDDSALQQPIQVGDDLHEAICSYRNTLPDGSLPPGEGKLMRDLLDLSRSKDIDDRRESQSMAERWAKRLLEKYPLLRAEEPEYARELGVTSQVPENLTQAQRDIWDVVVEHGRRVSRKLIATMLVQKRIGQNVSTLKQNLAVLSRQRGVLPHRDDTSPPGYGLPDWK